MNIIRFEYLDVSNGCYVSKGEFVDAFEYKGNNYLVTRHIDSYSELNDKIEITEIVQDWYPNGICVTYGNAIKSDDCVYFEDIFNQQKLKEKITIGWLPYDIIDAMNFSVNKTSVKTTLFSEEKTTNYIGLISDAQFKDMKDTLERVGDQSVYQLQSQIDGLKLVKSPKNNI